MHPMATIGCSVGLIATPNQRRPGVPMTNSTLVRFTACLSSLLSLVSCSSQNAASTTCNAGDPSCSAGGGSNGAGGSTQSATAGGTSAGGGTSAVGGVPSTGTGGFACNGTAKAPGGASAR